MSGCKWAAALGAVIVSVSAQQQDAEPQECFTSGNIVGAVIGTIVILALLAAACYAFWKYYWTRRQDGKTLTLVTNDPEAGLADQHYAFDNPGFLTEDASPQKKAPLKASPNDGKSTVERNNINAADPSKGVKGGKWQAWSSFSALVGGGSGKKNSSFKASMDDSYVGEPERDFVPLKGHDFTGLGFNICGNMREGIYVRDVLHRGPASESGRIAAGDRIVSINISLRHMVFEDALTILSYASPYDVQLEIERSPHSRGGRETGSGKRSPSVGPPDRLCHPFYRSQSIDDLNKMRMSSMGARQAKMKKSTPADSSSHVSVVSNTGTTGRKETVKMEKEAAAPATRSNVTMPKPERLKKPSTSTSSVASTTVVQEKPTKSTSSEKMAKFGVKVLPFSLTNELNQRGIGGDVKTTAEVSQNEENKKIEEHSPEVEQGEDVPDRMEQVVGQMGQVVNEMKSKVEEKHIPTEMPEEMRLAAQAAVSNRKSHKEAHSHTQQQNETTVVNKITESLEDLERKKRRAPPPPKTTIFKDMQEQFDENMSKATEFVETVKDDMKESAIETMENATDAIENTTDAMENAIDDAENASDAAMANGTTIELGSSHITIHQAGKEEEVAHGKGRDRKAASLGDLSRFDSEQPMSIPLERAVSLDLDMVDVNEEQNTGTAKKRKAPTVSIVATSETAMTDTSVEDDEDDLTPTNTPLRKEPVATDLAGAMDTFNRRLKKSSQWGTLEEALNFELTSTTIGVNKDEMKTVISVANDDLTDELINSGPSSITYINHPEEPPVPPTSPPPTITFISTATPTLQHITEIQVLTTGGNVSENHGPGSMDYTSSTTIRHGTSGGNLLLVANKLDDETETKTITMNHVHEQEDGEVSVSPTQPESIVHISTSNVTVMPINLVKKEVKTITYENMEVVPKTMELKEVNMPSTDAEKREVMQITANELDDIMMSHSSYLKTAQSPENQYSTFEQWVFLDQDPQGIKTQADDKKNESVVVKEINVEKSSSAN